MGDLSQRDRNCVPSALARSRPSHLHATQNGQTPVELAGSTDYLYAAT
jgi:hypothetical protein